MSLDARLLPALAALLVAAPAVPPPARAARSGSALASSAAPAPALPARVVPAAATAQPWSTLEAGLELGVFAGPGGAPGDGKIWVVRIDPVRYELRLVNASAGDSRPRTVRAWTAAAGAVAGINAGMFQTDGLTSVGLMRTRAHLNNPRRSARFKAVLAFDPVEPMLPPVRLLDAACGEVDACASGYGTLIQSIRMVSCDGKNVWSQDARRWSTAAVGVDGLGRTLFIHARSPWPVHDLVDALLALPLDLRRAMYVEGGPEAQLVVRAGGRELERLGAREGQADDKTPGLAWEIPNALVAVRRGAQGF